jgi:ParB family chromosome partitioning protein
MPRIYKVDVDTISATVKQEFAAKERGKANKKAAPRSESKPAKKSAA